MRHFAIAALTLLCASAAFAAPKGQSVVLPESQITLLLNQCSREAPATGVYWVPTPQQIADLEAGFDAAVAAEFKKRAEPVPPEGFDRQYMGVVSRGKPIIYVNAYVHEEIDEKTPRPAFPPPDFWKTNAVVICGGGSFYFGAVFDPASKTFSNFEFNGLR